MVRTSVACLSNKKAEKGSEAALSTMEINRIDINTILEHYGEWILTLARKQVSSHLISIDEVDDLFQTTLIAFWLRLVSEKAQIVSPRAYLVSMVHSRAVDITRQKQRHKVVQPLLTDQHGEVSWNDAFSIWNDEKQDPALICRYQELMDEVVEEVLKLPMHQRRAMICLLKDEVEDISTFAEILRKHGINIDAVHWPQDAVASQRLRSSLSVARRKFRSLKADIS